MIQSPAQSKGGQHRRFVTIEGGEGSGKTSLISALREVLEASGESVFCTREPGGSQGAEDIRSLLIRGDVHRWPPMVEAFLHNAARADHVEQTIRPALASHQWVLCDRFIDSMTAYQGYGQGLDLAILHRLQDMAVGALMPNLTLILDMPAVTGLARARERNEREGRTESRYEAMGLAFHENVRRGFLAIAADAPDRCRLIQADQSPHAVLVAALGHLADCFGLVIPSAMQESARTLE